MNLLYSSNFKEIQPLKLFIHFEVESEEYIPFELTNHSQKELREILEMCHRIYLP